VVARRHCDTLDLWKVATSLRSWGVVPTGDLTGVLDCESDGSSRV